MAVQICDYFCGCPGISPPGITDAIQWGQVQYYLEDSEFFGIAFGGKWFSIGGVRPGFPSSGEGGDINYFYQGMLSARRGMSMPDTHGMIEAWNKLQETPDRYI